MARTLIGNVRGPQGLKGDTGERGPQGLPGEMTASSVAALFSSSTAYGKGDYVTYGGQLYRFTADHAAGDWTGADATAVAIVDEFKSTFVAEYGVTTFNEVDEQVQLGNFAVVKTMGLGGDFYATLNGVSFGERGFGQYTAYHFDVPPDLAGEVIHFIEYELSSDEGWATHYTDLDAVNAGIVSQFTYTKAYNVGDYVIHNGVVYKFATPHTAGNYWSNSEVTQAVLADDLSDLKSALSDNQTMYIFPRVYIDGGYYDKRKSDCGVTENSSWCMTDKIRIENSTYRFTGVTAVGTNPVCVYYDSNGAYLSYFSPTGASTVWKNVVPPVNAAYVAFSLSNQDKNNFQLQVDYLGPSVANANNMILGIKHGLVDAISGTYWTTDAVFYEGIRRAYYIGYVDSQGWQGIISIDADSAHIVRTPLFKVSVDDHNTMGVAVRQDGRVVAIGTSHSNTKKHDVFISENPEDISSFDKHIVLESVNNGYNTYSTIVQAGNKYFLFWRENIGSAAPYEWVWYFRSTADFESWDNPYAIITSGNEQYYLMARKYDNTYIKLFMQSNATGSDTNIRLGYLNINTYDVYNADKSSVVGNVMSAGIPYTSFSVIKAPQSGKKLRLEDALTGTDNSFLYAEIVSNDLNNYVQYFMRDNGSGWDEILLGSFGDGYGPSSYVNTGAILNSGKLVFPYNASDKWELREYAVDENGNVTHTVLDVTNSGEIKYIKPKALNSETIVVNRGYYSSDTYTDYYTALHVVQTT